jgi:hypothetical protein
MNITNPLASIHQWHTLARPHPSEKDFQVQLGCHFEEIAEMFETIKAIDNEDFELELQEAYSLIEHIASKLKRHQAAVAIHNREGFIDSIADQVVTGVGTAYCADMRVMTAIDRVDASNWSKFVNGKPVFNNNGKIAKPDTYKEPDLRGCY